MIMINLVYRSQLTKIKEVAHFDTLQQYWFNVATHTNIYYFFHITNALIYGETYADYKIQM